MKDIGLPSGKGWAVYSGNWKFEAGAVKLTTVRFSFIRLMEIHEWHQPI